MSQETSVLYFQEDVSEKWKIVMMVRGMNVEESEVIESLKDIMKDENDIKMMEKHPETNVLVPHQSQVVEQEKVSLFMEGDNLLFL